MIFDVSEEYVVRLIIGYLKESGFYDTLCVLELETGCNGSSIGKEMQFLQKMLLQGRWTDVLAYIKPFRNAVTSAEYQKVEYLIRRQYFLETLSSESGDISHIARKQRKEQTESESESEVATAVSILKSMENLCGHNEFLSLCMCVTLERLQDSQDTDIASWSVARGRVQCFDAINNLLSGAISGSAGSYGEPYDTGNSKNNNGLLGLLASALAQLVDSKGRAMPSVLPTKWSKGSLTPPEEFSRANDSIANHRIKLSHRISRLPSPETGPTESPSVGPNEKAAKGVNQPRITSGYESTLVDETPVAIQRVSTGPPNALAGSKGQKAQQVGTVAARDSSAAATDRPPASTERRATSVPRAVKGGKEAGAAGGIAGLSKWCTGRVDQPIEVFQAGSPIRALVVVPSDDVHSTANKMVSAAIGSNDRALRTLRLTGDLDVLREWRELHRGSLFALAASATSGGVLLASGSNDKSVRITRQAWSGSGNTDSDSCLKGHNGTVRALQFNYDHQDQAGSSPLLLASGGAGDCAVRLWDVATSRLALSVRQDLDETAPAAVHGLCWLDGLVVAAGEDGRVNCFDPRTGRRVWTYSAQGGGGAGGLCSLAKCADASGTGGLLLTGHTDGSIHLVGASDRRTLLSRRLHGDEVRSVAIQRGLKGGYEVLTASSDGTAGIWSVSKSPQASLWEAAQLCKLVGHTDKVLSAAFVPGLRDLESVVTSGADGRVLLWNPAL